VSLLFSPSVLLAEFFREWAEEEDLDVPNENIKGARRKGATRQGSWLTNTYTPSAKN
jgi:hypothetical protein